MTDADDWTWFRAHPDRAHRCRLASAAEIATLGPHDPLAPGCGVLALSRLVDGAPPEIQTILQCRDLDNDDLSEDEARAAWADADRVLAATLRRRLQ